MKLTPEFIEKIEEEYLKILIRRLQDGEMNTEDAKVVTKEFLELTPFKTTEDMEAKIQKFTEAHPEYGGIYINLLKYEDESKTAALLTEMRGHLKNNNVDQALHAAQKHNDAMKKT